MSSLPPSPPHWRRWAGWQGAAGALRRVGKRPRGKSAGISLTGAWGRPGTGTSHGRGEPRRVSRASVLKRRGRPMPKGGLAADQLPSIDGLRHGCSSALTANGAGGAAVMRAVCREPGPLVAAGARVVLLASPASGHRDVFPGSTPSHAVSRLTAAVVLGARLKDVPPGIGTRQELLAKYKLPAHG
jgi:hypothetical protein